MRFTGDVAAPESSVARAMSEKRARAKMSRGITSAVHVAEAASPTRRLCDQTKNSTFTMRRPASARASAATRKFCPTGIPFVGSGATTRTVGGWLGGRGQPRQAQEAQPDCARQLKGRGGHGGYGELVRARVPNASAKPAMCRIGVQSRVPEH